MNNEYKTHPAYGMIGISHISTNSQLPPPKGGGLSVQTSFGQH